jgi:hypothetical protein
LNRSKRGGAGDEGGNDGRLHVGNSRKSDWHTRRDL